MEPWEPEPELARFAQCRESGANFVLWTEKAPAEVRPWTGKANCGDVLPCYDGKERVRLCERCAKSRALGSQFALYVKTARPTAVTAI